MSAVERWRMIPVSQDCWMDNCDECQIGWCMCACHDEEGEGDDG